MKGHEWVQGHRFAPLVALWLVLCWSAVPCRADEKLVYRLKWLFNASVAGDLYAHDHGRFRSAGLDVHVKAGGPERDAIKELELGFSQFGVASADQVIRAVDKGAPVVVIAQIFQKNPLQWIYRSDGKIITRPSDLRGLTIGITYGGNDETIMRTLLAGAGLTERDVRLFSVRYDYTPFYRKRVDIWPVYRNSQGLFLEDQLRESGEPVRFMDPAAFGVHFVANSVVTSKRMMEERPDTVKRFVRALLNGWEDALTPGNRDKVLATLKKFDRDTGRAMMVRQLDSTRSFVKPSPDLAIGTIDIAAWRQTEAIMLTQGQIDKPIHIETRLILDVAGKE